MILYYDCFSGISGDMNLASLIDLGVPKDYLEKELKKLKLTGYIIDVSKDQRNGITGTKVKVILDQDHHHHRNLSDITEIINNSDLNTSVKNKSLEMFQKLAEAEAKVHDKDINEIHFHEVGAIDSIVDIIGAAICLDYLKPDRIICSAVELGSGTVKCEHGLLPVPAPATAELLKNIPVKIGNRDFEATTPTGAVILVCNVDEFRDRGNFVIEKVSYGIGHKVSESPNVLRVFKGELVENEISLGAHVMFECNLDDLNPEITAYIMDKLFATGADDVFITPIIMKKSRNGSKLSVLCNNNIADQVSDVLTRETSTFGFRKYAVDKVELQRDVIELETKYGMIRIKRAFYNEEVIKQKAEFEDCKKAAMENNIPLREVYKEVEKLFP